MINICAGGIYGWSVISNALVENYQYANSQTQLIFGCCFMANTFSMLLTGRLQARFGPSRIALIGALLLAGGYCIASVFSHSYPVLVLSLGLVLGLGISCCYMSALSTVSSIFHKSRGVASGVVVAGYGFGAIVLSKIFEYCSGMGYSISRIFLVLSILYGAVIVVCSFMLPRSCEQDQEQTERVQLSPYLKDREYIAMIIGMFCCSFTGLLVIGNLKSIGLNFGLSDKVVSLSILAMALGNSSGRVIWGAIFDRLNSKSLLFMTSLLCLGALCMYLFNQLSLVYLLMVYLTTCCFGGCFSVYPSYVSRIYGAGKLGFLYPPVIVFHGLACLIAAPVGGLMYDKLGGFRLSLIISSIMAAVALICHLTLSESKQKFALQE